MTGYSTHRVLTGGPRQLLLLVALLVPVSQCSKKTPPDDPAPALSAQDFATAWNALPNGKSQLTTPKERTFDPAKGGACGLKAPTGIFYCAEDATLYRDPTFAQQIQGRLGQVALDLLKAHALGHHAQVELGVRARARRDQQGLREPAQRRVTMRVELQADCFAGVYAGQRLNQPNADLPGQYVALVRALRTDPLSLAPDSAGHEDWQAASEQQRKRWFSTGLREQRIEACETFGHSNL